MTQLEAFLLTLAIEVPFAFALTFALRVDRLRTAIAAVLGTCITHPFVWWLGTTWTTVSWWPRILALELGAASIESAVYFFVAVRAVQAVRGAGVVGAVGVVGVDAAPTRGSRMTWASALALGFATNALSFTTGLVLAPWLR